MKVEEIRQMQILDAKYHDEIAAYLNKHQKKINSFTKKVEIKQNKDVELVKQLTAVKQEIKNFITNKYPYGFLFRNIWSMSGSVLTYEEWLLNEEHRLIELLEV